MNDRISAHEPEEELSSSVEQAFEDAASSEKRWAGVATEHRLISVELPDEQFVALQRLAQERDRPVGELASALLEGILSPLAD